MEKQAYPVYGTTHVTATVTVGMDTYTVIGTARNEVEADHMARVMVDQLLLLKRGYFQGQPETNTNE